jgi:4'-phosphopantetheinyl transferase EntD
VPGNRYAADERRASISDVLPANVISHELRGEECTISYPLVGGEELAVARAVVSRRSEFAAVRHCARQALGRLGYYGVALLPDDRGAPLWPDGVVGSMTHVAGYCAAAVTKDTTIHALGIDAAHHKPLPRGVLSIASSEGERRGLGDATSLDARVCWDTVLFSSKEAVYKAWYPLTRRWLGFEDVFVEVDPGAKRFRARLLGDPLVIGPAHLHQLTGRFAVDAEVILTAVAIGEEGE